jgi:RimJ/RimL family protein N-acetyltransferase
MSNEKGTVAQAPASEQTSTVSVVSPFPAQDVPRIWSWIAAFRKNVADDFGPQNLDAFVKNWQAQETGTTSYAVYRGGELGGMITITPISPVLASSHCLFKKEFWGVGTTDEAMKIVYGKVFDAGFNKISSMAFADNGNIKAMAKRLGAKVEGVFRQQTMRNGKLTDMVSIGLTKEDFYGTFRTGYEDRLASAWGGHGGSREFPGGTDRNDQPDHEQQPDEQRK